MLNVFGTRLKSILLLLAFVLGASIPPLLAQAQESEGRPVQYDAIDLDPQAEFKAPTAIVEKSPVAGVDTGLIINVNGRRFELSSINDLPEELRGHYEKMSVEYQMMFNINRVVYLTRAAQLLSWSFTANMFGTGALIKDRIRWSWDHLRWASQFAQTQPGLMVGLGGGSEPQRDIRNQSAAEQFATLDVVELKPYIERREEIIRRILINLDRSFFSRPYLVANSNEFGGFVSLGPTLFGGGKIKDENRGLGGSLDIGLFFGWNKTDSSVIIQIFRLSEKFRGTMTGITGNAAIVPKAGIMFANVRKGHEMVAEKGVVQYPPTPPGVSSYFLNSDRRFAIGVNPPLGLIPYPLDAILIYSMSYIFKPLMRISLRVEVLKDFIKVDTGPRGEFRSMVKTSVNRAVQRVQSMITGRSMCVSVNGRYRSE